MIASFSADPDFTRLIYGLGFLTLAVTALALRRPATRTLPWSWLAAFGFFQAIFWGLELLTPRLGESSLLSAARLAVFGSALVALFGFGRKGLPSMSCRASESSAQTIAPTVGRSLLNFRWGRGSAWSVAAAAVIALAAFGGSTQYAPEFGASLAYLVGLPAALWAGLALLQASWSETQQARTGLRLAAIGMLIYAVSAGLLVPEARFFPASWFNDEAFLALLGFPLALVRTLCVLVAAAGLWQYRLARQSPLLQCSTVRRWLPPVAVILLLGTGWLVADRYRAANFSLMVETAQAAAENVDSSSEEFEGDWDNVANERLRTGLPVILGTFFVAALLMGVCALAARLQR